MNCRRKKKSFFALFLLSGVMPSTAQTTQCHGFRGKNLGSCSILERAQEFNSKHMRNEAEAKYEEWASGIDAIATDHLKEFILGPPLIASKSESGAIVCVVTREYKHEAELKSLPTTGGDRPPPTPVPTAILAATLCPSLRTTLTSRRSW